MGTDNRGAFGSNAPLERIPYVEPTQPEGSGETKKLEVLISEEPEEIVPPPAVAAIEDEPVYLREELRPPRRG